MTSHAVSWPPFGLLTISPDIYCAAEDSVVCVRVAVEFGWEVVFAELELLVHAVINTQAMIRKSMAEISLAVLFILLNEPGEYFKKSFHSLNYITLFPVPKRYSIMECNGADFNEQFAMKRLKNEFESSFQPQIFPYD